MERMAETASLAAKAGGTFVAADLTFLDANVMITQGALLDLMRFNFLSVLFSAVCNHLG